VREQVPVQRIYQELARDLGSVMAVDVLWRVEFIRWIVSPSGVDVPVLKNECSNV
jgi:hypothetical protein